MNWRALWSRFNAREQRLIAAAGLVLGLLFLRYFVVSPFVAYRMAVREEIAAHREMLENAAAYVARAGDVTRQREVLQARFREMRSQLVPGDTPTLAAASLQDTLHSLANEKGVSIQSTQVMREETIGDFRRIAVRLNLMGELRQIAELLAGIEYGPLRLSIPFIEVSKRGAVLRGQAGRAVAAVVEVSAFTQGSQEKEAEGADATPDASPSPGANGADVPEGETTPAVDAATTPEGAPTPAPQPTALDAATLLRIGSSVG